MRIFAQLFADQLRAAQHVGPLIIAAELHVAAIVLEQVVEIVALHDHVVELQEGEALFHALLVALGTQHVVHREAGAHISQQFHVIQLHQPLGIVQHQGLALAKVDEPAHLLFEAVAVVLNVLGGQHFAHISAAGRVTHHAGAAAQQRNGPVAAGLQALHQAKRHEMAHMKAVRRGVKANVEGGFALIDHFSDFGFVGHLGNQAAGNQFIIQFH